MSWTYSGDPSNSRLDAARFLVGDTDTTDQLLSDQEVNYAITAEGGILYAGCAMCCETLARKFSRDVDVQMGRDTFKETASQRAAAFIARAKELRAKAIPNVTPYSIAGDPSYIHSEPIFTRDMMSNFGTN